MKTDKEVTEAATTSSSEIVKKLDINTVTQDQVPVILEQLQKKLKEMTKGYGNNPPHITANIPAYGDVSKITDVPTLVKLLAGIRFKAKSYDEILAELEINSPKFKFQEAGHTLKQWEDFLIYKIQEMKNKSRIDKLKSSIAEMENFLSEEDKFRKRFKSAITDVWDEEDLG